MKSWALVLTSLLGLALSGYGWAAVSPLPFQLGLLAWAGAGIGLSVLAARRQRTVVVFLINTWVCLLVGVVLVDRLSLLEWAEPDVAPSYSFVEAEGRPEAFLRWREQTLLQRKRNKGNMMPDPRGVNPRVPRPGPGSQYESTWWINSLGFRGPEISRDKGDLYRIVALGESTTFGATLRPDDRPWPEVLETRIAQEYRCDKPVQVVNAGIPGWSLANNLARLDSDIFPLEPDLLISYHGYNGFSYILRDIPSVQVGRVPSAPERPSALLERLESAARVWWFKRRYLEASAIGDDVLRMDVHLTRYAELYRSLVFAARARRIDLALCSFNMAVTTESPEAVVRFYEPVFPDLRARVLANHLHSLLVREIAAENDDVLGIDTSAGLDGAYRDAYVDPVHFTQMGRQRLAENILEGIRPLLVGGPAGCRPVTDTEAHRFGLETPRVLVKPAPVARVDEDLE